MSRKLAIVPPASSSRCDQASSPVYMTPPAPANAFDRSVSFGLGVGSKTMRIGLNPLSKASCGKSNSSCHRPWPDAAMVTRSLISYASRSFMQSTCRPWLGRLRLLIGLCRGAYRNTADCVGNDRFKEVTGFLARPVVDVEHPLPPIQYRGELRRR